MIAPSRSLPIISPSTRAIADARFAELGPELSFGRHAETSDRFVSAPIVERVGDLHEAFADPDVDAVLTVIGGTTRTNCCPTWTGT